MQEIYNTIQPYLIYLMPPLIGAFIGFLTNKVAIRMLFRPLYKWKVLGIKIPMTPGVIPSKRHELAVNIGQMVGEHLLTSEEIKKALRKKSFQTHLLQLIETKVGGLLAKDLGPLATIIPTRYKAYFEVAVTTVKYQIKESVINFINTQRFEEKVHQQINDTFDKLLQTECTTFFPSSERENIYGFTALKIEQLLHSNGMQEWVNEYVRHKVYSTLQQRKSLAGILPGSLQEIVLTTIKSQTPVLLERLGSLIEEPGLRDKLVRGIRLGVEDFIDSMGPMGAMVHNFVTMETIEEKVREYLDNKQEDISRILLEDEVQQKVATILQEKGEDFLQKPLVELLSENHQQHIESFCDHLAEIIIELFKEKETTDALVSLFKASVENHLLEKNPTLQEVADDVFGEERLESFKKWASEEAMVFLRSQQSSRTIEQAIDTLINDLLAKPVGRLHNLMPAGVRDGMYISLCDISTNMLEQEIPGVVHSLNIRKIVTDKIDSLDLLKLETLLLSIMEEQFKYINLFGALLGFLIGCLNLIILLWA